MTLNLDLPPVAPLIVLGTVKALSVVRDPSNNYRYLTLAFSEEDDWDDGTDGPETVRESLQAVFLSAQGSGAFAPHKTGVLVELDPELKVIMEPAELKILSQDELRLMAGLTPTEAAMLQAGQKIQAIKALRERTGWGLRESKEFVDEAQKKLNY